MSGEYIVKYGPINYSIMANYEKRGPFRGWQIYEEVTGYFNTGKFQLFASWVMNTKTYMEAYIIVRSLEKCRKKDFTS